MADRMVSSMVWVSVLAGDVSQRTWLIAQRQICPLPFLWWGRSPTPFHKFTSGRAFVSVHHPIECEPMDTTDPMETPRRALALVPEVMERDTAAVTLAASSQCSAKSKQSGDRCKRRAIPGGAVCVMHGGKAPQVQAKALLNLRRARDAALDKLNDSITTNGDMMDPRALLDIVVKLTDKVELLEGRATERTESSAKVEMEARAVTIRASIEAKLEDLAARIERQAGMTANG